jgi:pimeloyl-ACP methyl ester carboxylesterase/DNA-binding CsgD family transcriptional regulator/class 3 adenylate cyclase
VYGYCLSQLGEPQAAEDATSQTFLKALAAIPTYREAGRFRPWPFAIAHNAVLDAIRGQRPEEPLGVASGIHDPTATPEERAIATFDLACCTACGRPLGRGDSGTLSGLIEPALLLRGDGMTPRTRYARSGDLSIAYQVVGDGPIDLVHVPAFISHLEYAWAEPSYVHYLQRLSAFSRLILFDKRGTGLSDRSAGIASLEERMDDVRAVMEAAGSQRAVIYGVSEGAPMACLFAATYPERTIALVLQGAYASEVSAPDYPWPPSADELAAELDALAVTIHESWGAVGHHVKGWGGDDMTAAMAPSAAGDPAFRTWFGAFLRLGASPGAALALARMNAEIDVRHILPTIRVPTLILHRKDEHHHRIEESRYVADRIPGARLVRPPGIDYFMFVGEVDALVDEIEAFVTGTRPAASVDSVLATVLVIEMANNAEQAVALGDRRWGDLQERMQTLAQFEFGRYRGRMHDLSAERIVATFDGPVRAIRCATAIGAAVRALGLTTRAGLHTGECELRDGRVSGVAVPLAAWVASQALPNEILVSNTVKDLVAGAELRFADRGVRALGSGADARHLFAVLSETAAEPGNRPRSELAPVTPFPTPLNPRIPQALRQQASPEAVLSAREQDVLHLVATGLTDQEIANALFLSRRTVNAHVARILAKLDVRTRREAALRGRELGLLTDGERLAH